MLLSGCAGAGQNHKQPVIVAAKPVVKTIPHEEPVLPRLKPKTPKKAPASPKLSEPEASDNGGDVATVAGNGTGSAMVPDTHQHAIGGQGSLESTPEKDADAATGDVAALPAVPTVIKAEPEPVGLASPDELKSKAEGDIVRLLGRPVATRSEGTGTVWTYRTDICSLDVYFFLDVADNKRRALSYEMMPAWTEDDATQSCYKALKSAHHVQ